MESFALKAALENVRAKTPLVHCITNYVTVNDCANALLACGGSPIMSDEPQDVVDITTICGGLVLNIGTLNLRTINGMQLAGTTATQLGHPILLDPVGAGASTLRTQTAAMLLDSCKIGIIRANMSEVKALVGASATTRGVDVNPDDMVTPDNLVASADYARTLAKTCGAIVAITGAIDIVADGERAFAIYNGKPIMGRVTGTGCMLSCTTAAYAVANPENMLEAVLAAVAGHGVAGEIAQERMKPGCGNGSFRTYFLDALYNLDGETLETRAKVEKIS